MDAILNDERVCILFKSISYLNMNEMQIIITLSLKTTTKVLIK